MMGRKRKHRKDLPQRVYFNHNTYFFVDRNGKWINLGKDYIGAMAKYAEINQAGALLNLGNVMDRYQAEVIPTKAPRTQKDNLREIGLLRKVFAHMRPDDVTPVHVYKYMELRPPVRANREKNLLSHIYSHAIKWGAATNNPCRLVKRNTEQPRNRYIEDWEFEAIYDRMPAPIQCAMKLSLLTGLRQGDVLNITLSDWKDEGLVVRSGKTGKRLLFARTPELEVVIEQCKALPSKIATTILVHNRDGQRYTTDGFKSVWQYHMTKAMKAGILKERFTFHDIRAKAGSEAEDGRLLGHVDKRTLRRHYERAPIKVTPLKPGGRIRNE